MKDEGKIPGIRKTTERAHAEKSIQRGYQPRSERRGRSPLMRRPILKCPFCDGVLPNTELRPGRPLKCPSCCRPLQLARWHIRISGLIALGLTMTLCRFLNLGVLWLFGATILLWFPIYVIWDALFVWISNPRFEAYVPKAAVKSGVYLLDISGKYNHEDDHNEGKEKREG